MYNHYGAVFWEILSCRASKIWSGCFWENFSNVSSLLNSLCTITIELSLRNSVMQSLNFLKLLLLAKFLISQLDNQFVRMQSLQSCCLRNSIMQSLNETRGVCFWENFSKVSSLRNLLCTIAVGLSFEKFHHAEPEWDLKRLLLGKFLECQLATQFVVYNHCKGDIREISSDRVSMKLDACASDEIYSILNTINVELTIWEIISGRASMKLVACASAEISQKSALSWLYTANWDFWEISEN